MKIIHSDFKDNKATIQLEETHYYFVNALRRVMIAKLPKLAINDVIIYDNTSPLFDEIIAHRIAMIPIPTDLRLIGFRDECKCNGKGCPNCTVRYTLSKEEEGLVYSGDLVPENSTFAIKDDKIPIVELFKGQRIILEVEAVLGTSEKHAKWQTVIAPTYTTEVSISFDNKNLEDVKEFLKEIPEDIVELKGNILVLKDRNKLPVLESYIDKTKIDFINIKKDPAKITFNYETDGSIKAKEALLESSKIIQKKYEEFDKLLQKLK
ncbi:MAG: DNA-directed RNA polymerase subunit D [Thermoplasmatota archaeon]